MRNLSQIPVEALRIEFLETGACNTFMDGYVHKKTAPCLIIAQAVEGRYEVRTPQGLVVAEPGEAFLATVNQPLEILHRAAKLGGKMKARWLHARFLLFATFDFTALLSLPGKATGTHSRQLGAIIAQLLRLKQTETLAQIPLRNELAFRTLRILSEISPLSRTGMAFLDEAERLAPVLAFIRRHLAEPLTIDQLADTAHLSRSRFHAYFREIMGLSPMDYVKGVRLDEARQLLLTPDASIKQIAEATGFANPYHFSREFKAKIGIAPVQFKKMHTTLQV